MLQPRILVLVLLLGAVALASGMGRPKKDYRRLKKQEGAIKLVGGERGPFEGTLHAPSFHD